MAYLPRKGVEGKGHLKSLSLCVCVSQGVSEASDQHNTSFLLDCRICKKLLLGLSLSFQGP